MKMDKKRPLLLPPRRKPQMMLMYCSECKRPTQHVLVIEHLAPDKTTIHEYFCCEICR